MYDVAIIGAGPAGLFAAYELIEKNNKLKVALLDKGHFAKNRKCPLQVYATSCVNCKPCAILSGYGGAGTFSDGKLNFIPKIGKTDLFKYMTEDEAYRLIDDTEEIFNKFGMDNKAYPSNMEKAQAIKKDIEQKGAKLLVIKQKHLGSDKLPTYIQQFTDYLIAKGVEVFELAQVVDVNSKSETEFGVRYIYNGKTNELMAKNVVIAPGRTGAKWIEELTKKYSIPYFSDSIEVGVRVEVNAEIMKDITSVIYDPTIFITTPTYKDQIRTFCTNPNGFVAKENYEGYICVNGHALKDVKSNNTNFAFISKITLSDEFANTRSYGEHIASVANSVGGGKPIMQYLGDLRKSEDFNKNSTSVIPTLKDCVQEDLSLVLPHRIIVNILEGLEKLNEFIPGVNNDETILYGPEIKFFSNEIITDNNMKIEGYNMYFIGDGCGKTGNIVSAAATGIIAARDILKKVE